MEEPTILVVGSGPSGLSVAFQLRALGIATDVVDRYGMAGGAYCRMAPSIELISPPKYLQLDKVRLEHTGPYATVAEYRSYLQDFALRHKIEVRSEVVYSLDVRDGYVLARLENSAERYSAAVLSTGMFDFPNIPQLPGVREAVARGFAIHASSVQRPEDLVGDKILVVGAGMRGVEISEDLARCGRQVSLSGKRLIAGPRRVLGVDARSIGYRLQPLVPKSAFRSICENEFTFRPIDRGIGTLVRDGAIQMLPRLSAVDPDGCIFADGRTAAFDLIVLATGHNFEWPALGGPELHGELRVHNNQLCRNPYVGTVGYPCARYIDSSFVHGIRRDAALVARQIKKVAGTR